MSIERDKNGKYLVRYDYIDARTGEKKRTKKRGFETKFEAKEFERSVSRDRSTDTFIVFFDEYLKTLDVEKVTITEKVNLIKKHLPYLNDVKYEDLTKKYLVQIRNNVSELKLANSTKNKILNIIKATCRYANDIYDLKDNSKVIKTFKRQKRKVEIWNIDEYFQFESKLPKEYVPFFHLIFFTGLRRGEAKALQVDDLDIKEGTINIAKAIRLDVSTIKGPKTPDSERKVLLDKNTLELVKPLKSNEKWLFGDYKIYSNSTIARIYKKAIEDSGVKPIRLHDLRHSHCSILIGNGIDVVSVAKRVGHKDINTTLSTYSHALENADNKIVDFLNGAQNVPNK